jgi:mono/diheme cytochrome c family protein
VTLRTPLAALGALLAVAGILVATRDAAGSDAAPPLAGASLFAAKGCASCHAGPASSSATGLGPPLVDAASWAGERRPGLSAEAYLAESIREPAAFISPARTSDWTMPRLDVTDEEVDRLVAFLLGR